jgi:mannose-1-phosphate guanylyltransferase
MRRKDMKAMILAAGLGTRLGPLTEERPKALMPVVNIPIITRNIEYLKSFGVRNIAVNTHHHYNQILDYLDRGRPFGIYIDARVEAEILGTGGGIKNFQDLFDAGSFVVMNSDILTNIDLATAYEHHKKSGNIATLILHNREPFNHIRVNNRNRIIEIIPKNNPDMLAFTGIHIMEPEIFNHIQEKRYSDIIDCYRLLIQSGGYIGAYISESHYWYDIGTLEGYISANKELLARRDRPFSIESDSCLASSVILEEWAVVGKKAYLGDRVKIQRSILWDNVTVKDNIRITDSVITSRKIVDTDLDNEIY